MKKIFIVYATAGEGHKQAALSIKSAFDSLNPPSADIRAIDILDHASGFCRRSYPAVYLFLVKYIPYIWGFFYYLSDMRMMNPLINFLRRVTNKANCKAFEEFLCEEKPDIVVCTHFMASEVISDLKRKGRLDTRLVVVVTDFRMHSFWWAPEIDKFLVSFDATKGDLVKKWGCVPNKIYVTGIPVRPQFFEPKDRKGLCQKYALAEGLFTVLVTSGGFGVGPVKKIVSALSGSEIKFQVLVVCGHNESLRQELTEQYKDKDRPVVKVFGFVNFMDELMSVSDIMVAKAGGLISSESIAKGLPLLTISSIPGQESRNCGLLVASGAAIKLGKVERITGIVEMLHNDRARLQAMKDSIKKIARPNTSLEIAKFVLNL